MTTADRTGRALTLVAVPVAAVVGAIGVLNGELALMLSVGLIGFVIILVGSVAGRSIGTARLMVWFGIVASLGIKPPRRVGSEVLAQPVTMANSVPTIVLVVAVAVSLVITGIRLRPITTAEKWLGAFAVTAIASAAWSVAPQLTLLRAGNLAALYVAIALLHRFDRTEGREPVSELATVVHLVVLSSLVWVGLSPGTALAPIPGATIPIARLKGVIPYVHPNALAFLAVVSIVLAVAGFGFGRYGTRMGPRVLLVLAGVAVIGLTRTRSALVYLVLAAAVGVVTHPALRRRIVVVVPVLLVAAVAVGQLAGGSLTTFVARGQTSEQLGTLTGRVEEWNEAVEVFGTAPLLGNGYYAGHRFGELALTEGEVNTTTDNAWLDVAVDLGLVGLVTLAGFVLTGGRDLVRGLRAGDRRARPALAVFGVCLAASFVNPSLNEANYWAVVFAFIVMVVAPALERQPGPTVRVTAD